MRGLPATVNNLVILHNTAKDIFGKEFIWSVCATGRTQFPLCTASLLMGAFTRVGFEDNLYMEKGRLAKSSAEQVEKIVRVAKKRGLEPASPDEARQISGLKGMDNLKY